MQNKTSDGYTVTTIEQDGSLVGEELGRVYLIRRYGYDWWSTGSVERARQLVTKANTLTAKQFRQEVKQCPTTTTTHTH